MSPSLPARAEAIVVGGGPAGSATAWGLARAGIDTLLVDRARFPRDKACSEYLSPQAARLLEEMGALAAVEAAGAARLAGMTVRAPSGAAMTGRFAGTHSYHAWRPFGLALRRTVLDAILLDRARAAGAQVAEGARLTGLDRDPRGRVRGAHVSLPDESTRTVAGRLVVGADGLRSIVARRLGLARRSVRPRRVALVTHYRDVADVGTCGEMHVDAGGYCGIADVGGGESNVAVVVPAARAAAIGGDAAGFIAAWMRERPHLAPRFRAAGRTSPVLASGPFASRARRAWAPGAALVGDAADFFDPFTGEGIYAALRGAELLVPYAVAALRAHDDREADGALAAYDRCRRHEFGGKWRVERLVGLAVAVPPLLDRAVEALARRPAMADIFVGVTGDFVPPREVLRPSFLARLLAGALIGADPGAAALVSTAPSPPVP